VCFSVWGLRNAGRVFFFNLCVLVCEEDGMLGVFFFSLCVLVCEEDGALGVFFFNFCVLVCEEDGMLGVFSLVCVFWCVRKTECWAFFL